MATDSSSSSLQQTLPSKLLRPSIMIPPSMLYPPGGFEVSNLCCKFCTFVRHRCTINIATYMLERASVPLPHSVPKAPCAQLAPQLGPTGLSERPNLHPHWVTHRPSSSDGGPVQPQVLLLSFLVRDSVQQPRGRSTRRAVTAGTARGTRGGT